MNDEDMKKIWQHQAVPETEADLAALVTTAREKHRKFQRTIFWRDFREVGVAIVLIPIWIWMAVRQQAPWTTYLMVPALLFVAGFMVIDRLRRKGGGASASESVVDSLGSALRDVDHQIWLLRNVQWWYVGPIFAGLVIPDIHSLIAGRQNASGFLWEIGSDLALAALVWGLNQWAVKKSLVPQREELKMLLEEVR
jgi:hypothetical protein